MGCCSTRTMGRMRGSGAVGMWISSCLRRQVVGSSSLRRQFALVFFGGGIPKRLLPQRLLKPRAPPQALDGHQSLHVEAATATGWVAKLELQTARLVSTLAKIPRIKNTFWSPAMAKLVNEYSMEPYCGSFRIFPLGCFVKTQSRYPR
eukprot:SAG31_NODE_10517_length_1129_cov_1.403883_1_plen_148_part_00